MANKGKVSAILQEGKEVSVKPYNGGTVTAPLVVPALLLGFLEAGTVVVYEEFEDGTGIVLSRMDGEINREGGGI